MASDLFDRLGWSPEKKRTFIMNAIRYINLFMLVLGFIVIVYLVTGGKI